MYLVTTKQNKMVVSSKLLLYIERKTSTEISIVYNNEYSNKDVNKNTEERPLITREG